MIRLPPTRILPGPQDIHSHLERVFLRVTQRYNVFNPVYEEEYEDDFGDDLPSINDEDASPPLSSSPAEEGLDSQSASGFFDPAYGCQRRRCSSQMDYDEGNFSLMMGDLRGNGKVRRSSSSRGYGDQESRRTNGSYETAIESVGELAGDGPSSSSMSYGEFTRASRHSPQNERLSLGSRVVSGRYPWAGGHSLLPRRFNPMVLLALPQDRPAGQHTQVSSLRSLFEELSLNTLPDCTVSHQKPQLPENQTPHPASKQKTLRFDTELDDLITLSKDSARSLQITYPSDQTTPERQDTMPAPARNENTAQADVPMHDAIQSEGEGMRGEISQNRKKTRMSDNMAQGSGSSGSGRRSRNSQAFEIVSRESPRTLSGQTRNVSQAPVIGANSRRSRQSSVPTRILVNPQGQNEIPQPQTRQSSHGQMTSTAHATHHRTVRHPTSSLYPISTIPIAPAMASRAPSLPPHANLSPEKANHLAEMSSVFHQHVSQMLAEVDQEGDNADLFGLGTIRRRPLGACQD